MGVGSNQPHATSWVLGSFLWTANQPQTFRPAGFSFPVRERWARMPGTAFWGRGFARELESEPAPGIPNQAGKPWATGPRPRCPTGSRKPEKSQGIGGVHPRQGQYYWQERRDSRLTRP